MSSNKIVFNRHHLRKLHRKLKAASVAEKTSATRQRARQCLTAHDSKLVATITAYRKLGRPRVPTEILAIAEKICPWKGTAEPVKVFSIPKGTAGNRRMILKFGIENRTLQYLVRSVLTQTAKLHPHQFALKGVKPAIVRVAAMMAEGYVFAREIDIKDCFPSFEEEKLVEFLPLPKEVILHVIMSAHLNLVSGNLHDLFGHTEDGVESPLVTDAFVQARRGISQGSAASNIVSEITLSSLYHALPADEPITGYADNSLLMGKTEEEVVTITKAFEGSIKEHPVGLLEPKMKGVFNKGQSIDYLGHRLTMQAGKVMIAPRPDKRANFELKLQRLLKRIKKAPNPYQRGEAERACRSHVYSWTSNYSLCEGIDAVRKASMAKLEALKK